MLLTSDHSQCKIGEPFILVMEYAEHGNLLEFLRTHELTDVQRIKMVLECCFGLEHMHALGFVHRDVAARNVLLGSDFTCKISGMLAAGNDRLLCFRFGLAISCFYVVAMYFRLTRVDFGNARHERQSSDWATYVARRDCQVAVRWASPEVHCMITISTLFIPSVYSHIRSCL